MGIAPLFVQVVTSVEHGRRKPDPCIFRDALAGLGVSRQRALFIGDSLEDDYRGAAAAGLRCVLIDSDGRHGGSVELRIASLFELEWLLEQPLTQNIEQ